MHNAAGKVDVHLIKYLPSKRWSIVHNLNVKLNSMLQVDSNSYGEMYI